MMKTVKVKLDDQDFILPVEGYDAFVEFLYRIPSQPELLEMRKSDIIAAYKSTLPKSLQTGSRRSVIGSDDWEANYKVLESYHAKHGTCSVPFGKETGSLRSWTERQKKLYASSKLEPDRVDRMKALDFNFTVKPLSTRSINTPARKAAAPAPKSTKSQPAFVKSTTASTVSSRSYTQAEKNQSSNRQKQEVKFSNAPAAKAPVVRKSSLAADEAWNKNYEVLKDFQAKHGTCSVPFGKETGALRSWTERQRKLHAISKLDTEKTNKMIELGFAF